MSKLTVITFLALSFGLVSSQSRIAGGSVTTILAYPYMTALLRSSDLVNYAQNCAGSILTSRSILTSASVFYGDQALRWRVRAGSSFANSGGTVYNVSLIILHPYFDYRTFDNDIAILRTGTPIIFSSSVSAGIIANSAYVLPDNQAVYAIGWGATSYGGPKSEQLRHVQIWSVNQNVCKVRYTTIGYTLTDNMLCSGWLDVGGRDQCLGDLGGPLLVPDRQGNVIVGISSWTIQCGSASILESAAMFLGFKLMPNYINSS